MDVLGRLLLVVEVGGLGIVGVVVVVGVGV